MAYKRLLIIYSVMILVIGEDEGMKQERKSRFISFETTKNEIEVSLDFNVPFLSIPIKNTINSMFDGLPGLAIPKINLNPSALAFGSFVILASSVLLPLFSKSFSTYQTDRYYRVLETGSEEMLMDFTNQVKSVSGGCPSRIACWMSQRSNDLVHAKTVERILRNKLVSSIFNATVIDAAFKHGRRGRHCSTYKPCPLSEEDLPIIIRSYGILTARNVT